MAVPSSRSDYERILDASPLPSSSRPTDSGRASSPPSVIARLTSAHLSRQTSLKLLAFNEYVNEDGTGVGVVQVHPNAASMEIHMQVVAERAARAYAKTLEATTSVQVYGEPSGAVLEMLRRQAGAGVPMTVKRSTSEASRGSSAIEDDRVPGPPAPEIASEMFVSVNTIRTHTRRLYVQTSVSIRRRKRSERVRELGLLAPTHVAGSNSRCKSSRASRPAGGQCSGSRREWCCREACPDVDRRSARVRVSCSRCRVACRPGWFARRCPRGGAGLLDCKQRRRPTSARPGFSGTRSVPGCTRGLILAARPVRWTLL